MTAAQAHEQHDSAEGLRALSIVRLANDLVTMILWHTEHDTFYIPIAVDTGSQHVPPTVKRRLRRTIRP